MAEPLPPCGDDDPESYGDDPPKTVSRCPNHQDIQGLACPIDDGWADVVDMTTYPAGVTAAQVLEEVGDDGVDTGSEPDQPQV